MKTAPLSFLYPVTGWASMPQSALDRAIRKLVDEEGDGDFDKQVADLIVAEAREKNDKGSKKIWRDEV